MRFLFPSLFYFWAALIAVPIVLYLIRPRPKTVRTSTLPFFKWLAREHQDSTWLKRLKYLLSLLITLLIILMISSALGRLVAAPGADEIKTLVIVVDRSASMAAVDDGVSRIEHARSMLEQRVAGVPAGVGVIVMAYDNRAEVLLSRSLERRQIQRAISSISVRPVPGNAEPALQLARELARIESPAAIWHVTDASEPNRESDGDSDAVRSDSTASLSTDSDSVVADADTNADAADADRPASDSPPADSPADSRSRDSLIVEHLNVAGSTNTNAGITALQLRRLPLEPDQFEVFAQIHASGSKPLKTQLEVSLDGDLVGVRELTIQPGAKETMLVPVESSADTQRRLVLRLKAEGDLLSTDDVAFARVPRYEPLEVLWITESPDPFTELALTSLAGDGALDILQGKPSSWPPQKAADVVLFDGWLPDKWPDQSAIIINPPRSLGELRVAPVESGLPMDAIRATNEEHPLLFGVATARMAVTQTAVIDGGATLQPVWVGSQGPLLLAGQNKGQRVVVLAFSPEMSEQLPLTASYPLLVGNALYWTSQSMLEKAAGMNRHTGEILSLGADGIAWTRPDGTLERDAETSPPQDGSTSDTPSESGTPSGKSVELDRVGWWESAGLKGSASLLSADETLLAAAPSETADKPAAVAGSWFSGDLAPGLMWIVLLGLIVESLLYHRYWIY